MAPKQSRPDPADRLAAIHAQLVTAVEQLVDGDAWRRMLEVAARFPTYSSRNVLLIALRRPDATRCCGIRTWNSLGRRVRKGEKGIAILAPCLYRKRDENPEPADPGQNTDTASRRAAKELRGFRVVHVFDPLSRGSRELVPPWPVETRRRATAASLLRNSTPCNRNLRSLPP
jgi:hypothetical protein